MAGGRTLEITQRISLFGRKTGQRDRAVVKKDSEEKAFSHQCRDRTCEWDTQLRERPCPGIPPRLRAPPTLGNEYDALTDINY